jgi:hypothetical protein
MRGRQPARNLLLLLLLALAFAACEGDDPGYQVLIENKSSSDLVMVMEGAGFSLPDLGGTPRKAFLVPPEAPATAGPYVYVGFETTGAHEMKSGRIRLYTADCRAVAVFEVKARRYSLSVDEAGAATIEPYDRGEFPEGTPRLAFAPQDCP